LVISKVSPIRERTGTRTDSALADGGVDPEPSAGEVYSLTWGR
jgi:hypothetical protein